MAEYLIQDTTLTGIADEVRRIKSTESALSPADIESQLSEITRRTDSGNVTLNASTKTKSYPAGYYPNAHGATHSTVSRANTTLTAAADATNAKLTLTAGNDQGTGFVTGANKTATKTVTLTANGATVTASTNDATPITVSKAVASGSASTPSDTITQDPTISWDATNNKIKATYSGSKSITPTVTAGYVSSGTAGTVTTSGTTSVTAESLDTDLVAANVKDGVKIFNTTGTFTDSTTVSSGQTAASAANILTSKSAWVDGVEVKGSMADQGAKTKTLTAQGESYTIPAGYHNGSGKVTASLTASSVDNTIISGESVIEATKDYGYKVTVDLPAGYHDAQSITKTFSSLFPAPETPATADKMLAGYELYDGDGKLITGTMPNNGATGTTITTQNGTYTIPAGYTSGGTVKATIGNATITSGAGSATISDPAYNSTNDNFTLSASGTVAAPTVGTAGYISSSAGTKNTNTISGSKSLAKVGTGATISGTTTKAPTLARTAKPSGDTWVDAASGSATTTKPTSGPYVQIDAAANTGTLTATPKVTSAGYGTTSYYDSTAATAAVGAAKATTAYVPITTTSASISGKTVSYGTGWITSGSKSVADGALSADDSSISGGSFTPTLTYNSTSGEFDYGGSKAATGTAYAKASTSGYVTSDNNTSKSLSATVSATGSVAKVGTGVDITGTSTKQPSITRQAFTISGVTDAASGAATTTAPTSGVYVKVKSAQNTGTLTATPKVTSAGYGTTTSGQYSATAGTKTVGASASADTYIPIKTGTTSKTDATASASVSKSPSASTSVTGMETTTTDTGYKVTASAASGVATASVTASSASVSEGYTSGVSTSTTAKSATSTEETASDSKFIIASSVTNNTTLPSGSSSSGTVNRGSYIKFGKGYNPTDKYYQAQGDAHSSYTPSSTYFQTSTTGAVSGAKINKNQYATSDYYVKSTSASKSGGTVSWGSGWISSGSETVSRSDLGITDKAAATYNTSTSDQTIASGNYLTGAQTIKAVTTSGITASNIIKGAVIKVGDANSATRIANVTGTADYIKTVTSVPTTKDTSVIYNSTDGKYYLWK